ncbi:MAG: hypothetical protein ACR2HH_01715 [Chthoniobacterales bacterium]
MKTCNTYLSARALRCGVAALAVAFCVSALAGADSKAPKMSRHMGQKARKTCYVMLSNTSFPQPCDRVGGIPSTATPMDIIGEVKIVEVDRR